MTDEPTIAQPENTDAKPLDIAHYFEIVSQSGGSDLHLKPNACPHIRVGTIIRRVRQEPLAPEEIDRMVEQLLTDKQLQSFEASGSIDLAIELPGSDRFRLNIYRQRGLRAIAGRRVVREIPNFEQLHLPPQIGLIAKEHRGLVLVSGPTSCGKSTTIAAMLESINLTRNCHIVTIEDPIEFLYEDKKALISQREIGIDVDNFDDALRSLPRQDPDVVLIGEMRDAPTFQAALQVAETGHMVFGTVHASSAAQTVGRILDLFPPEMREHTRKLLAFNLKAVIYQRLLPSISKTFDRIPAVEIMLMNPSVRQLIEEARDEELPDVIRTHEKSGMKSFTHSLLELIEKNLIDPHVAYEVAPNVDELKMAMKGISSENSGLIRR